MIVFDLKCCCGCQFEGWFANRPEFDQQIYDGHVTCPQCGGSDIHKILSPVAVRTGSSLSDNSPTEKKVSPEITPEAALQFLQNVQDFVEKNFEDVGPRLAKESLKIHYGVAKPRNIRGVATADEEKMLQEEGIALLKIPAVKKSSDPGLN